MNIKNLALCLALVPLLIGSLPPGDDMTKTQSQFAFDLFNKIAATDFGDNIFISPLSAMLALAMTYNGAEGETKTAMADALKFKPAEYENINQYLGELIASLNKADSAVELNLANSIWYRSDIKYQQNFFNLVHDYYQAEMQPITDATAINNWVSDKTRGKITSIIDRINPQDIMFLINALYFKGMWTNKFDSSATTERDFNLLDGSKIKHPLMSQSGKFRYFEDADFQAISLPYGQERLQMYVFLPSEKLGLKGFLDQLNADNWQKWTAQMYKREGHITLPRFKLEYKKKLNDVLISMGMEPAFNPNKADFSGMYEAGSDEKLFISEVLQKTFVEVNEKGTEAAAVTSVTMTLTSASPTQKFRMLVDRPFFCAIADNKTGALLFMGAITNPK